MTEMEKVTLTYTDIHKVEHKKSINVPKKRHSFGISKVREGFVEIGWFPGNPHIIGYGSYKNKQISLPEIIGAVRLIVGKKVISKSV
jgi:hypothetical protein